jgi:LacI family transcriptional regulator
MGTDSRGSPTLADVARSAGVSLTTASRVINGSDRTVSPRYSDPVLHAAASLGYVPNRSAQAMSGHSSLIGLVTRSVTDHDDAVFLSGALTAAEGDEVAVIVVETGGDAGRAERAIHSLRAQRPRAIILAGVFALRIPENVAGELDAWRESGGEVVEVPRAGAGMHRFDFDGGRRSIAAACGHG